MIFVLNVISNKKNKSWCDLQKFEHEFGDYCSYMGYCPMIFYRPINGGNALEITIKEGGLPYKNVKNLIKDLENLFPNYIFKA